MCDENSRFWHVRPSRANIRGCRARRDRPIESGARDRPGERAPARRRSPCRVRRGQLARTCRGCGSRRGGEQPPLHSGRRARGPRAEVTEHEPRDALAGGADGLDVIRRLVPQANRALRPGGVLVMEIGHGQSQAVETLVREAAMGTRAHRARPRGHSKSGHCQEALAVAKAGRRSSRRDKTPGPSTCAPTPPVNVPSWARPSTMIAMSLPQKSRDLLPFNV